jgi:protein TonB
VDRSGQVLSSEIAKSSGSPLLDEEALAVFKRASPLPFPPDEIPDAFLENFMPYGFGMKPGR